MIAALTLLLVGPARRRGDRAPRWRCRFPAGDRHSPLFLALLVRAVPGEDLPDLRPVAAAPVAAVRAGGHHRHLRRPHRRRMAAAGGGAVSSAPSSPGGDRADCSRRSPTNAQEADDRRQIDEPREIWVYLSSRLLRAAPRPCSPTRLRSPDLQARQLIDRQPVLISVLMHPRQPAARRPVRPTSLRLTARSCFPARPA